MKKRKSQILVFLLVCMVIGTGIFFGEKEVQAAVTVQKPVITSAKNTDKSIILKWNAVSNAKGYIVYRNDVKVATIWGADKVSYEDTNVGTNGSRYVYRLKAFRKVGGKYYYSVKSAKKITYFMKYNRITTAIRKGDTTTVSWEKNPKASGYQIQYATKSNFSGAKTVTVSGTSSLKWTTTALEKTKSYYLRIRTYKKSTTGYTYSVWNPCVKIVAYSSKWQFAGNSVICSDSATIYYADPFRSGKKNKTVCINAGHGTVGGTSKQTLCHPDGSAKVTGGTTGSGARYAVAVSSGTDMLDGTPEASVTLALGLVVKDKLLTEGYNVLMIRENTDVQLDNVARTVMANNNADCHIALHYDSTTNNKGAFFLSVPNISSYRNMYPVSQYWKSHNSLGTNVVNGLKDAGMKIFSSGSMEMDLTQTSYSTIPSIDLEVGDRGSDRSSSTFQKIANGIVKGLNEFF